ncbi:MAG: phospholipase, partial [Alphaproteobacteria bacterium]|nr:phospholipase [Alphaproteobacteria bacterium]
KDRKSAPPILLVHGMRDDVIAFGAMELATFGLQSANINVASVARPDLGHSIDDVGLDEGLRFLRKVLS